MSEAADELLNAGEALLARARARGESRVYRCVGRDLTGSELARRALDFQRGLLHAGIGAGERVLLVLRDTHAFPVAFLGALRAGVIPIPVSTLLPAKDVAFIARDAGARAAFVDEPVAVGLGAGAFPTGTSVYRVSDDSFAGFADPRGEPAAEATRASDPAFWIYTSGTTGEPKGVVHRHGDLRPTAELYARDVLGMGASDRVLSASKLFFAYGLGNSLTFPLWLGAEAVLHPERPTPEAMFGLIEREEPTLFFAVPTLYAAMLAHPSPPRSLGRVRACVSAGEALAPSLFQRWRERFGVELIDGLGSTEMLHVFVSNRPSAARAGSCGTPVDGYRIRIVDEHGEDSPDGQVGTLLAHGPSAARCYWNRPAASASTMFAPGWLRTGDSVRRRADGTLVHEGRTDDLLKVGGIYVSPFEVESALLGHPDVAEVAVVGREDAHGLVRPRAFVVAREPARAGEAFARELREHASASLAPHKVPRWIEFCAELPKTTTGKIQRHRLREEPEPADAEPSGMPSQDAGRRPGAC